MRGWKAVAVTIAGLGALVGTAGCGNTITATRSWTSVVSGTTDGLPYPASGYQGRLDGALVDDRGNALPGQSVHEVCNFFSNGTGVCSLTLVTADRVYVAQGPTVSDGNPFGRFPRLGGSGSLTLARAGASTQPPTGTLPQTPVRVTARP